MVLKVEPMGLSPGTWYRDCERLGVALHTNGLRKDRRMEL